MRFILELVEETCINILQFNDEFRKKSVQAIKDFFEFADKRTIECVPSIELMLLHIQCFSKMRHYKKYFGEDFSLDKDRLTYLFRFAIEEIVRRQQNSNSDPVTKRDILVNFFPKY
jgi:hypothetical protein